MGALRRLPFSSKYWARFYAAHLGRFVGRDPIGYSGGVFLYLYVNGAPLHLRDPSGLDWLDDAANYSAGIADSLTMGVHGWVRGWIGINDGIDASSGWYVAGEATEIAVEVTVTLGAAASRHVARRVVRTAVQRGAVTAYRRTYRIQGGIIHHATPIVGHIGGRRSYFPLPYKFAAQGHWNFQYLSNVGEHAAMHRRLIGQEAALKYFNFSQPVRNGGNLLIQHVLDIGPNEMFDSPNSLPVTATSVRFIGTKTLFYPCGSNSNEFEYSASGNFSESGIDLFHVGGRER
ncbi:MAG: RHS repeat-associated core domain-containing protein [Pirellulaceae bacterium]